MLELLRISWRNMWRNRRRTFLTVSMVAFAVWISLIMRSYQIGSYDLMVDNVVHSWTGFFQIHAKGYQEDQILDNSFDEDFALDSLIGSFPDLDAAPRLQSFVLSSYGNKTKGVLLTGIDPDAENRLTSIYDKLISGRFISGNDSGAVISSQLASFLGIKVGDTLVTIGQGFQGSSAAAVFPVRGIVRFPSPELDRQMVIVSISSAREFYNAPGKLTSIAFNMKDPDRLSETVKKLKAATDPEIYEVLDWKEMLPVLVQQIESDNISGMIMLGILYVIIGFGILGTVLMITNERIREFGMMMAVGMKKVKIILMQALEFFQMGILGILCGIALGFPVVLWFHYHPIPLSGELKKMMDEYGFEPVMPTAFKTFIFVDQALVVLCMVVVTIVIASLIIGRLRVINALHKQ